MSPQRKQDRYEGRQTKLLLLGGSSSVGRSIIRRAPSQQVVATYCHHPFEGDLFFDAMSMNLNDLISAAGPFSHALILLGDTKPDSCFLNPQQSRALNVDAIIAILGTLKQQNILPVFFSTEAVFDGDAGNYREEDAPKPLLLYSQQKLEAESYIQEHFADHLILRLSLVVGDCPRDGALLSTWLSEILASRPLRCAADYVCSPIYAGDVALAVCRLIESGASGLFHVGGLHPYSRLAIGQTLVDVVRKRLGLIAEVIPCSMSEFDTKEVRPQDISLCSQKLREVTGLEPTDLRTVCERLIDNYMAEHPGQG